MPEGPEIRRAADNLEKQIAGKKIDEIFFGLDNLKHWEKPLTGAAIKAIKTYGKAMVICLDNQLNIYSHNQLYGRWLVCDTENYPDTKRQLRLAIDCQGKSALLYSASTIAVLDKQALRQHPFISKLGPDILHKTTTINDVIERLCSEKFKNRQLASILTDQTFVAGLGNYLRCEILFVCGLHPKTCSRELDKKTLCLLATSIVNLTRQSYQTAGMTNNLEHGQQLMKQGASFEASRFYVFRRVGLPCYRCHTQIEKTSKLGQTLFFCSQCQQVNEYLG